VPAHRAIMSRRRAAHLARWTVRRSSGMKPTRSPATVRLAVAADAVAIIDLHFAAVHRTASTFYSPEVLDSWSRRPDEARYLQMREIITGGDEVILVAEDASEVVGFGSVVPRVRELRAVYVHPDAGRRETVETRSRSAADIGVNPSVAALLVMSKDASGRLLGLHAGR
jgi:hypothetical protein